jgi:multidrug efflux pump subunit AcrB
VGLGALLFVATLVLAAKGMSFQLNAPGKPYETTVNFRLSPGANRLSTHGKAEAVRATIVQGVGRDNVRSAKARIGSSLDQRTGLLERGSNVGQIRFEFVMNEELLARHGDTIDAVKDLLTADPDISNYSVTVPQAGPPAGAEFSARLRGRDAVQVLAASGTLKSFMGELDGVSEVIDDLGLGKETFRVVVDQELASLYGLSERDVGLTVRTAIDGLLADEVSIDETQVEIVIRYRDGMSLDREGLGSIPITTQTGTVVRLDEVADVLRTREAGSLRRRDNQRQIEVQADLETDTVSVSEVNSAVLTHWNEELAARYEGVELAFGGETEDFNESLRDLIPAFGLVVGLIFVVLALQFRSYLQPLIILSAIPFGIIGAVWGLFLMGYDLSLFAFFGIVALAGIVVNDSLVMVDFINKRVAEGAAVPVAIVDGALARLRPILSTTLTTVFGLAPLALGFGGKDEILAPMAISIAGGLAISTGLVLLLVPVLYALVDDLGRWWDRWRGRGSSDVDSAV